MNGTASKVGELPTIDYATAITAPAIAVAADAGALGVRPRYLMVNHAALDELAGRPWCVSVQVDDFRDVDRLAEFYGLLSDDDNGTNYTREGVAVLHSIGEVMVRVYSRRPADDGAEVTR